MKTIGAAVLALFVAGCSVGPDYQRPEVQSPPEWAYRDSSLTIDSTAIVAADTGWWQLFGDTVLTDLIHTALTENTDIRIAAARVEEFMGLYGIRVWKDDKQCYTQSHPRQL